jgi:hypothetical protein
MPVEDPGTEDSYCRRNLLKDVSAPLLFPRDSKGSIEPNLSFLMFIPAKAMIRRLARNYLFTIALFYITLSVQ